MMCINKSDVHMIVEEHLYKHQNSLEKNLGLQFQLINTNIERVIEKVEKINGRVYKCESNIRELQDARLNKEKECPFNHDIAALNKRLLENVSIESFVHESDKKRDISESKRNRSLLAAVAVISLIVGILTLVVNYMVFY